MSSSKQMFTKLKLIQHRYVEITSTEFDPNRSINVKIASINSYTPLIKVWL